MNCRLAATSTEGIIKFYNARSVVALRAELKSRCVKRLSFFHCVLPRGTAAVIKRGARRVDGRGPSNKRIGMSKAFDMGIRRRFGLFISTEIIRGGPSVAQEIISLERRPLGRKSRGIVLRLSSRVAEIRSKFVADDEKRAETCTSHESEITINSAHDHSTLRCVHRSRSILPSIDPWSNQPPFSLLFWSHGRGFERPRDQRTQRE